jgi:bifunctional UDP-N-acetylglucosamine pyrophosphorylase / glucosamine-1-phosphate N-acetyltransferase
MKKPVSALVLAAGEGTRFRSETNKVLHPLLGKSMIRLVIESVRELKPRKIYLVVGHKREAVMAETLPLGIEYVHQSERKGTGHAVSAARGVLSKPKAGDVVILPGDLPLVRPAALKALLAFHKKCGNAASVLSAELEDPSGFGRIVREGEAGLRIVEEMDADSRLRRIKEVSAGIYVFDVRDLLWALPKVKKTGKKGEYYLTDVIAVLASAGKKTGIFKTKNPEDIIQINSRRDLSRALSALRDRKIRDLADDGVTVLNPASTWIDLEVEIGRDTVIYPSVVIEGQTVIGARGRLYPGCHIIDSRIADHVTVFSSTIIENSTIEDHVTVGPFARLRPKTILRAGAHIGNFVEIKNTDFGRNSKAGHLSYLGDTEVQEGVNIGAGTITCNYDGVRKNKTVIEAGAFIGSGAQLVAPVKIGRGAYVAAGSVITKDVSPGALAVARGRQFEKEGWAKRQREKQKRENPKS